MTIPNLDFVQPTNATTAYDECSAAGDTLSTIEWEPDGRTVEQAGFDDVPFSIEIET